MTNEQNQIDILLNYKSNFSEMAKTVEARIEGLNQSLTAQQDKFKELASKRTKAANAERKLIQDNIDKLKEQIKYNEKIISSQNHGVATQRNALDTIISKHKEHNRVVVDGIRQQFTERFAREDKALAAEKTKIEEAIRVKLDADKRYQIFRAQQDKLYVEQDKKWNTLLEADKQQQAKTTATTKDVIRREQVAKDKQAIDEVAIYQKTKAIQESTKSPSTTAMSKEDARTWKGAMPGSGVGSTFGHKFLTTAQYAAAGTALFAGAAAVAQLTTEAVKADLSMRTMAAVMDLSVPSARNLSVSVRQLGESYGGSLEDIDQVALSLGRAGVASGDLVGATKVVVAMARLTGDTFEQSTSAVVSFQQVFGNTASIESLGNKLAYIANVSRLSTQDIGTFSNYALAAAKDVGLTEDAVGGLAAAFSNAGVNASTIGTQIRRFTTLLTDDSEAVSNFYLAIGVNQANLARDIQKGGAASNKALLDFVNALKSVDNTKFTQLTGQMDILAANSLQLMRNNTTNINKFVRELQTGVKDQLDNTKVILDSYIVSFESAWNSLSNTVTKAMLNIGEGFKTFSTFTQIGANLLLFDKTNAQLLTYNKMLNDVNDKLELNNQLKSTNAITPEQAIKREIELMVEKNNIKAKANVLVQQEAAANDKSITTLKEKMRLAEATRGKANGGDRTSELKIYKEQLDELEEKQRTFGKASLLFNEQQLTNTQKVAKEKEKLVVAEEAYGKLLSKEQKDYNYLQNKASEQLTAEEKIRLNRYESNLYLVKNTAEQNAALEVLNKQREATGNLEKVEEARLEKQKEGKTAAKLNLAALTDTVKVAIAAGEDYSTGMKLIQTASNNSIAEIDKSITTQISKMQTFGTQQQDLTNILNSGGTTTDKLQKLYEYSSKADEKTVNYTNTIIGQLQKRHKIESDLVDIKDKIADKLKSNGRSEDAAQRKAEAEAEKLRKYDETKAQHLTSIAELEKQLNQEADVSLSKAESTFRLDAQLLGLSYDRYAVAQGTTGEKAAELTYLAAHEKYLKSSVTYIAKQTAEEEKRKSLQIDLNSGLDQAIEGEQVRLGIIEKVTDSEYEKLRVKIEQGKLDKLLQGDELARQEARLAQLGELQNKKKDVHTLAMEYQREIADQETAGYMAAKAGLQSLESGMMNFFDVTSDGWLNWHALVTDILNSIYKQLLQELVIKQMVSGIAGGISSAFGNVSTATTYGTNIGSQQTSMLAAQDAGFNSGGIIPTKGYANGGVLTGGSGIRDDIYLGNVSGTQVFAMGGEFITRKDSVNADTKGTLDYINKTGSVPSNGSNVNVPVSIKIDNQTGQAISADMIQAMTQTNDKGDYEKVVNIVLRASQTDPRMRGLLKGR